jgi:hypothetical protein
MLLMVAAGYSEKLVCIPEFMALYPSGKLSLSDYKIAAL